MMNNTTTPPSTMTLKSTLQQIIEEAVHKHIASSISLFVGCSGDDSPGDITIHRGHTTPQLATCDKTIYDLASLTKILGTTLAVAKAIDDGTTRLDETPFPSWPHGSIRSLLAHTAGLVAHKRFYEDLSLSEHDFHHNRTLITQELFLQPTHQTTERLYSDLGFMALGFLLEERYKKPLWDIFGDTWKAFGITPKFVWFPSSSPKSENSLVTPTFCHARNAYLRGQVHDANCWYLGGLAGHAGLFGSLSSVKVFAQALLSWQQKPRHHLHDIVIDFAHKTLGFDAPAPDGSNYCLSSQAFGHFGYTGVSLWIDPALGKNGTMIALLTNRIHESNQPEGIFWLRKAINEAVVESITMGRCS